MSAETVQEPAFAEWAKQENARELREERGELETSPEALAAPEVPAESVPSSDAAVAPVQASDEALAAAEGERNPDGTFKAKTPKVSNTGEWARNKRLTAELAQTRQELERLRATPAPAAAPVAPPAAAASPTPLDPSDPEPTIDRFLDRPDPYAALAVEAGKWAVRETQRQAQQAHWQAQRSEAQGQVVAREEAFTTEHPDYPERVPAVIEILKQTPAVLTAMADDELGPAVAYHLASHLEEARRIATLTPHQGVVEIGKLISRLTPAPSGSGTPAGTISRAKPLIKPVSGSPMAPESKPPEELPFGPRYIREMNAKERREREGRFGA